MAVTPAPYRVNLTIWQGQTYDEQLQLEDTSVPPIPDDLTGFTATMMLRGEVADDEPVATWSSETGELVLGGEDGTIAFALDPEDSIALPTSNETAVYFYDLLLTHAATNYARRVVEGVVVVYPAVTRAS